MPKTKTKIPGFTKREIRGWIRIQKIMREYDRQAQEAYAKEKGEASGLKRVARNMLAKGYSVAEIIGITNLPREQVRALKRA
ncbi:MAG: hypothetical protein LBC64_05300 [Fibromonadaceae bacterium]|nr:hypothetical protein [Fibromonadaceae bacterium]